VSKEIWQRAASPPLTYLCVVPIVYSGPAHALLQKCSSLGGSSFLGPHKSAPIWIGSAFFHPAPRCGMCAQYTDTETTLRATRVRKYHIYAGDAAQK